MDSLLSVVAEVLLGLRKPSLWHALWARVKDPHVSSRVNEVSSSQLGRA